MTQGLKVIAPEFEIDVSKADNGRTLISVIDTRKERVTDQKIVRKPMEEVIEEVRDKIGEVIQI